MKLYNDNLSRIFVLDKIRISKLMEIFQSSMIALLLSIYLGTILDEFLSKYIIADYENTAVFIFHPRNYFLYY